jgi:hypothetical protein
MRRGVEADPGQLRWSSNSKVWYLIGTLTILRDLLDSGRTPDFQAFLEG